MQSLVIHGNSVGSSWQTLVLPALRSAGRRGGHGLLAWQPRLLPGLGAPPVAGRRVQASGGSGHARLRDADKPEDSDYTVEGYARHLDGVMVELGPPGTPDGARLRRPLGAETRFREQGTGA